MKRIKCFIGFACFATWVILLDFDNLAITAPPVIASVARQSQVRSHHQEIAAGFALAMTAWGL